MSRLRLLDLFSGIGGFSLGLERTGGFETVAFCEIEPFPRRVLAKHWPKVPCYEDIRTLNAGTLHRDGIEIDAICGGFPCQDISTAGKGAGIEGERSGLWSEYARLIGELRPRVVFVENVAALLGRGLDRVLGDLAAFGYDAEWHCIPAAAVGAPHRRDRLWIVAYPNNVLHAGELANREGQGKAGRGEGSDEGEGKAPLRERVWASSGPCCEDMADANGINVQGQQRGSIDQGEWAGSEQRPFRPLLASVGGEWLPEPELGRVAHGVPDRSHRLKALGNAVVPQIPELLGRAYLKSIERVS